MDDDRKPIDASIRPVLPSRADMPVPRFDLEQQVAALGADSLLPPTPPRKVGKHPALAAPYKKSKRLPPAEIKRITTNRKKNMKKAKKTDPKRSAAARASWKTRHRNLKHQEAAPVATNAIATAVAALCQLDPAQREMVMQLARALKP